MRCPLILLLIAVPLHADDWPHWRGPQRSGVVKESSGWKGKPLGDTAWKVAVGEGSTSPIVGDGKVYTMGWRDGKDFVRCLDVADGKELWKVSYSSPQYGRFHMGDESIYGGCCSTPEFDPTTGLLYTLGIDGDLFCWNTRDKGRKVWGINLNEQFKIVRRPRVGRQGHRDYGYTSSPLVHGDALLVEVGAAEGNLIAFDKKTGKKLWASRNTDPAGHNAGPAPIAVENVPCVAVLTIHRLIVVRLDKGNEGKTIAEHPWETDFANNIAAPAVHGDNVLITSAYNRNAMCRLKITLDGAKKIWEVPHPSKVCTPVIHDGHVYVAWRSLKCLDWETGKLKWEGGNFGDPGSCIVTGDDRILVFGERGKLMLAETAKRSPDKLTILESRDRMFKDHAWPHVVLARGRIFCKDRQGNLVCIPVSKP